MPGVGSITRQFSSCLKSYLESYWIVLRAIKYLAKKPLSERDILKKINSLGNKLYKLELAERFESLSRITFENGLKYFCEKGAIKKNEKHETNKKRTMPSNQKSPMKATKRILMKTSAFQNTLEMK